MEILSHYNLFNKKNNLHQKKTSQQPQKITLKLLEEKLFKVSIEDKSLKKTEKNPEKNNAHVYLNKQFEETLISNQKQEETIKKTNKISLSNAISKYERSDSKKKGFLPAILDFNKKNTKLMGTTKRSQSISKIEPIKNNIIFIEENNAKEVKRAINSKETEKKTTKSKKTVFSNAKYFKNAKTSKNFSMSFPNLSDILVSQSIQNEKSPEKPNKNKEKYRKKKLKGKKKEKTIDIENKNDFGEIKSVVLLDSKRNKAKYRDEDEKNGENSANNRKVIKI